MDKEQKATERMYFAAAKNNKENAEMLRVDQICMEGAI